MQKLIDYIFSLVSKKFSGDLIVTFSQGGIRSVKKAEYEKVELR